MSNFNTDFNEGLFVGKELRSGGKPITSYLTINSSFDFIRGLLFAYYAPDKFSTKKLQDSSTVKNKLSNLGCKFVDCFVSGYSTPRSGGNLISGLKFSVFDNGCSKEIAVVRDILPSVRKDASFIADGNLTINPNFIGKCAELLVSDLNTDRVSPAILFKWKPFMNPFSCSL